MDPANNRPSTLSNMGRRSSRYRILDRRLRLVCAERRHTYVGLRLLA
jgi:hypothetical protein